MSCANLLSSDISTLIIMGINCPIPYYLLNSVNNINFGIRIFPIKRRSQYENVCVNKLSETHILYFPSRHISVGQQRIPYLHISCLCRDSGHRIRPDFDNDRNWCWLWTFHWMNITIFLALLEFLNMVLYDQKKNARYYLARLYNTGTNMFITTTKMTRCDIGSYVQKKIDHFVFHFLLLFFLTWVPVFRFTHSLCENPESRSTANNSTKYSSIYYL